jgi:hypothetical protein
MGLRGPIGDALARRTLGAANDMYDGPFEVNILPSEGQNLPLTQAGMEGQVNEGIQRCPRSHVQEAVNLLWAQNPHFGPRRARGSHGGGGVADDKLPAHRMGQGFPQDTVMVENGTRGEWPNAPVLATARDQGPTIGHLDMGGA